MRQKQTPFNGLNLVGHKVELELGFKPAVGRLKGRYQIGRPKHKQFTLRRD